MNKAKKNNLFVPGIAYLISTILIVIGVIIRTVKFGYPIWFWGIFSIISSLLLTLLLILNLKKLLPLATTMMLVPSIINIIECLTKGFFDGIGMVLDLIFWLTITILITIDVYFPESKKFREKMQLLPIVISSLSFVLTIFWEAWQYGYLSIPNVVMTYIPMIIFAVKMLPRKEKKVNTLILPKVQSDSTSMNDSEMITKLKAYKELYDNGIITAEEFESKKSKVINHLS